MVEKGTKYEFSVFQRLLKAFLNLGEKTDALYSHQYR